MLKSSSASTRLAFRAAGTIYAVATAFFAWAFVYELRGHHDVRTGLFTYGLFTLISAVGLFQVREWGRTIGLVVAVGSAGLGILTLMSTIFGKGGPVVKPTILLVVSLVVAVLLSRSTDVVLDEHPDVSQPDVSQPDVSQEEEGD